MRESKLFAQRTKILPSNEVRRKYFLVFEGSETEIIYFQAVNQARKTLGIHPLIELVPIMRSHSEQGMSNPVKILERLIDRLEKSGTDLLSYEDLLDRIMDYLYEEKFVSIRSMQASSIWSLLIWICREKLQVSLDDQAKETKNVCEQISKFLSSSLNITDISQNIISYIASSDITYSPGFDEICLFADRDWHSFKKTQYLQVLRVCAEKSFRFYVANPCFEFWLLLHFDEVLQLDRESLLQNDKVSAKKNFTEQELSRLFSGYRKSHYQAEKLMPLLPKAIRNKTFFCEDIHLLERYLGSNIGLLMKELGIKSL